MVIAGRCPTKYRLLDVWKTDEAHEKRALALGYEPFEPPEQVVPCPLCGEVHSAWDPETAVCPRCGEPGCLVETLGMCWDQSRLRETMRLSQGSP